MSVGTKKIKEEITIEGAEMHNLKNISLKIPKKKAAPINCLLFAFSVMQHRLARNRTTLRQ